jgi:hypothetical protein
LAELVRFTIDPDASRLELEAQTSLLPVRVSSSGIEGHLDVGLLADDVLDDDAHAQASMRFEIRHLQAANPLYAREIEHLLESRRHPVVAVELTGSSPLGAGTYAAEGTISLRGVTRPLDGELVVTFDGAVLQLVGERVIDVRELGVDPPHFLLWRVHPDVTVRLDVTARRE